MDTLNLISLAVIGYIDYMRFKIQNVILIGWIATFIVINQMYSTNICINPSEIIASTFVAGSIIPLRRIVKCHAGDFKLYGILTATMELKDKAIILLTHLYISMFPMVKGVKMSLLASQHF